mgnify:CR=1 FL=1
MNWKIELRKFEEDKKWDEAVDLMINVLEKNPDEKDCYICLHYFFMNLITEEVYDYSKYDYYIDLQIKYLKISDKKYLIKVVSY